MTELERPVDLCTSDGRLSPAAIGWSRRPLHRCNLAGRFGRKKRWDFWCVTDGKWLLTAVVAEVDLATLGAVSILDVETHEIHERNVPWLPARLLPDTVGGAPVRFDHLGLRIDFGPGRIALDAGQLRAELRLATDGDSLNVVVPRDDRQFWFTSKKPGVATSGFIEWAGRRVELDGAWATLDFGRGIWPLRTRWNWAVGHAGTLSVNLGGRWTDGTGATENGLFIDGELFKIHEAVHWEPGRIRSRTEVDLTFRPLTTRRIGWPPHAGLFWQAGRFSGRVLGQRVDEADEMFGWSEALDIVW